MSENTIFIGGSRHLSRLPTEIKHRLDNVMNSGHQVILGDANGADKAVQKYFHDASYAKVTVFCSGNRVRNNLGPWPTRMIVAPKTAKGFQFYAAKDREMAREADFGLMIWDAQSSGTVLNVLRLMRAGKIAVLFNVPDKRAINIKTPDDWHNFLNHCDSTLLHDLRARATPDEWPATDQPIQPNLLDPPAAHRPSQSPPPADPSEAALANALNAALAAADPAAVVDALGGLAKLHGMSLIAKETGLARESLYRALSSDGNPEFATVLKVLSSLGLHLHTTASPTKILAPAR